MSRLSDDLQASLRSGDLFAPYSGCQYLLMVLGASSENAGRHRRAHPHAVYVARCARCGAAVAV